MMTVPSVSVLVSLKKRGTRFCYGVEIVPVPGKGVMISEYDHDGYVWLPWPQEVAKLGCLILFLGALIGYPAYKIFKMFFP